MAAGDQLIVAAIAATAALFFSPVFIAFFRHHRYRWVIFGLCVAAGWTAIGWAAAFAWAVWPKQGASAADAARNDRSAAGESDHDDRIEQLERLAKLKSLDAITEAEFRAEKGRILCR